MSTSLGAFITCILTAAVLCGYTYFIIYIKRDVVHDGMKFVFMAIALILLRMLIPINFPFTKSIYFKEGLPTLSRMIYYPVGNTGIRFDQLIIICWMLVTCTKIVYGVTVQWKFRRYLYAFKVRDWSAHEELKKILDEYQVPNLTVCILPFAVSPALFGIRKPILLLPDMPLTEEELYFICRHEMEHYRNHDLLLKLFVDLVVCFQWFNPLAYIMRKQLILSFELSNDSNVLKGMEEAERCRYAMTLLKVAELKEEKRIGFGGLSFMKDRKIGLKIRVDSIIAERKDSIKRRSGSVFIRYVLVAMMLLTSFLLVPEAYRIDEEVREETLRITNANSYIMATDTEYQLYVDGEYTISFPVIPEEFVDFPIVEMEDMK